MKVVLLAGGLGTRMREETEFRPKPMVKIGGKPIIWHIMKLFASYGHKDFVICAGYKAEIIQDYFFNFGPKNMDFTMTLGDPDSAVFHGSPEELGWTVTVAQTGFDTPTGGRIKKIEKYLEDETFFCTYGDGLAAIDLDALITSHSESQKIASMTVTQPNSRFGVVNFEEDGSVTAFREKPMTDSFVNIGYFLFEPQIFDFLTENSVLEEDPLTSVAQAKSLNAFVHEGFWQPMDTYRESLVFNELWNSGKPPWKTWD
jgi:glucose-1-phosphate cytidylyltransferase